MSSYFDARVTELDDMRRSGADYPEYYAFEQRIVEDVGIDVELLHPDPSYNFPADLKAKVYALFRRCSYVMGDPEETETRPQSRIMRELVDGLHDIYHERAHREHPLYDAVYNGRIHTLDRFKDGVRGST